MLVKINEWIMENIENNEVIKIQMPSHFAHHSGSISYQETQGESFASWQCILRTNLHQLYLHIADLGGDILKINTDKLNSCYILLLSVYSLGYNLEIKIDAWIIYVCSTLSIPNISMEFVRIIF